MDSQLVIASIAASPADVDRIRQYAESLSADFLAISSADQLATSMPKISPGVILVADSGAGPRGVEAYRDIRRGGWIQPVILTVAEVNLSAVVSAMRGGIFAVTSPAAVDETLFHHMQQASECSQRLAEVEKRKAEFHERLESLAAGELEVLRGMLEGKLNKRVANQLSISERTVEARRKRIFDKMETRSVACLTRRIIENMGYDEFMQLCEKLPSAIPAPHFHMRGSGDSSNPTDGNPTSSSYSQTSQGE